MANSGGTLAFKGTKRGGMGGVRFKPTKAANKAIFGGKGRGRAGR